ncbi:MAG: hypothetical protein ACJAR4_000705 [Psychroserpens sp.]|jgi:hypothetical protein
MRNLIYICFIGLIASSCDDGDIFEVSLEFEQDLELCIDINEENFLLYETKLDPNESLSLLFPSNTVNNPLLNPTEYNSTDPVGYIGTILIDNSNTRFNYRTYNGDPNDLICQSIVNPGTQIIDDYPAAAGAQASFISTFEDDDNDGILTEFEGRGAQAADGSYPDAQDTDLDGLPDYIDEDDDNDGIMTIDEDADDNDDGNPDDALNSNEAQEDADGEIRLPNYLDNDDDGDGTFSANENENGNGSLLDDIDQTVDSNNTTPRYLDPLAIESFDPAAIIPTSYIRTIRVNVTILNANIGILSTDIIELGTYEYPQTLALPEEDE